MLQVRRIGNPSAGALDGVGLADGGGYTKRANGRLTRARCRVAARSRRGVVATVVAWICVAMVVAPSEGRAQDVDIPDEILRAAIEGALGKSPGETITVADMRSLTELTAEFRGIKDLTGLEHATGLTSLSLNYNRIVDVTALAGLTLLKSLDLASNEISDVLPLESLGSLEYLHLQRNQISDLSPLTELDSVHDLNLSNNQISDLSPLADLTSLKFLYLEVNRISDLSALANLTSLVDLRLSVNAISDVMPLAGLEQLVTLSLSDNEISSVAPLVGLTSLRNLTVSDNRISDLSSLAHMTWLEWLHMSNNGITDVSPLSNLTSLTHLFLSSNAIKDLSLSNLGSLQYLDLSSNGLSDVSSLAGPPFLLLLDLANNKISEISSLSSQPELRTLDLSKNSISDVSPVSGLGLLGWLDLSDNRISELPSFADLRLVETLHLSNNVISDVASLSSMASLIRLYLAKNLISDMSPLTDVTELSIVDLSDNLITHVPSLTSLTSLWSLDLSGNRITELTSDTGNLGILDLADNEIASVTVSNVASLRSLDLANNSLSDLAHLSGGHSLASLNLDNNGISDVSELARMPSLAGLTLSNNEIADVSVLSRFQYLSRIEISNTGRTDLAVLGGLDRLRSVVAEANAVSDVAPIAGLPTLFDLYLGGNAVADVTALVNQAESLDRASLWRNPLDQDAFELHLPALRERGVNVVGGGWRVPVFPSPDQFNQGFVRVLSDSHEGEVWVYGSRDETRAARLWVPWSMARHFNSDDLASGNSRKGLYSRLGSNVGESLQVYALEDIEVLAYIRTSDGFVTSMHDTVPWLPADDARLDALRGQVGMESDGRMAGGHYVAIFNPASNSNQQSMLRLANVGARDADVEIYAVDDRGTPAGPVRLTMAAHTITTLTSAELESGTAPGLTGSLGDGMGKWRLVVSSDAHILVMNLMSSPTGHLTNLSTWTESLTVPLFPAASHPTQQGFVRVANLSDTSGKAEVVGYDDRGMSFGPLTLELPSGATVHFNSNDWEFGATGKALEGAAGTGEGAWRLEFASELEMVVSAYLRTRDGFLTSTHDLVDREICTNEDSYGSLPFQRGMTYTPGICELRVPFFNPASNTKQVSSLRLVNRGTSEALVSVFGIDDSGEWHGPVSLGLSAGVARTLSSYELESHDGEGVYGALGDGEGKWELRVVVKGVAAGDVTVMSVLENPTGHLTNLSTWPDPELGLR